MTDTQSVRYHSIPNNKLASRIFTNWATEDLVVLVLGLLAITASSLVGDLFWLILSTVTTVLFLLRTRNGYGRIYYEIYLELVGYYIDIALGGILWQAEEEQNRLRKFLRSRWRAIPMRLTQVRAKIDGQTERYGLLEQLDRPYDYLYIGAEGGAFADLDINEDTDAVNTMANVINVAILGTELKAGASFLRIESPCDYAQITAEIWQVIDPIVARPERFKLDDMTAGWVNWARQNLNELRPAMRAQRVTKSHYLIVVSIKRKRKVYRKNRTFTDNQLRDLPIIELGRSLVDALANESTLKLEGIHCLGMAELANVIRSSWDVAGINNYNFDRASGLIPRNDDEIEVFLRENEWHGDIARTDEELEEYIKQGGLDKLNTKLQAWPNEIVRVSTKDKCVQMDSNYISTLRATTLPPQVRSDQARRLQYIPPRQGTWLRRASVGESASGTTQTNQLVVAESVAANWQNFVTGKQIVQHPKFATRRKALAEQAQVSSSQSVLQRFNYFWSTVGTDVDSVSRSRKASVARLQSEHINSKVVAPTALLVDSMICGCLGINRL